MSGAAHQETPAWTNSPATAPGRVRYFTNRRQGTCLSCLVITRLSPTGATDVICRCLRCVPVTCAAEACDPSKPLIVGNRECLKHREAERVNALGPLLRRDKHGQGYEQQQAATTTKQASKADAAMANPAREKGGWQAVMEKGTLARSNGRLLGSASDVGFACSVPRVHFNPTGDLISNTDGTASASEGTRRCWPGREIGHCRSTVRRHHPSCGRDEGTHRGYATAR